MGISTLDCLSYIPYTSLIGFILVFVGGGVMAGAFFEAVKRTDDYFRYQFYPVEQFTWWRGGNTTIWVLAHLQLIHIRIAGIFLAGTVVLLGFIILIFAFLSTDATRGRIYRGDKFILGGRTSATLFLVLTYAAAASWVVICALLVVPTVGWGVSSSVCAHEAPVGINNSTFHYTFNLTYYGIYFKPYLYEKKLNYREAIVTLPEFRDFCQQMSSIGPFYFCSWVGSVAVIMGLVGLIGALSSTYMRLKYTRELTEFRSAIDAQHQSELDYIVSTKRIT